MNRVRILVADDRQVMRIAYQRALETQGEFEIVGMAADGEEALEIFWNLIPDVAILDIMMPKVNGLEVAQRIIDRYPGTGLVIISSYEDLAYVSAIMKDGANGRAYILKSSLDEISELIRVVGAVANGQIVLDPNITIGLLRRYDLETSRELDSLTETEHNVLQLALEGRDNLFISQALGLHREEIEANGVSGCTKLGVTSQNCSERISKVVQALVAGPG